MAPAPSPSASTSQLFEPLLISMIGIVLVAIALVVCQVLQWRFCGSHRRSTGGQHQPPGDTLNGVDPKVLESIPIHAYTIKRVELFRVDQTECVVCLGELEEGDPVRVLPNCDHAFHLQCVDQWFISHSSCPLCRSSILAPAFPIDGIKEQEGGSHISSESHTVDSRRAAVVADDGEDFSNIHAGNKASLRPCASFLIPKKKKLPISAMELKRSMSMDSLHVLVKIPTDQITGPTSSVAASCSSSSSSSAPWRIGSFKKSFSRFCSIVGQGGGTIESLPK